MKIKTAVKQKFRSGQPVTMAFLCSKDANLAELMALCGVDIVILDNEHFTFSEADISGILRALSPYETACMLRTTSTDAGFLSRLMELGINGIMAQQVKSAEHVRKIIDAVKYYPEGSRGFGMSRALSFGAEPLDPAAYMKAANDNFLLIPVVEDEEGASHAAEIAAIPGVDSVNVGAMDLSLSMGYGSKRTPEVMAVVQATQKAIKEAGSICADFVTAPEQVPELIKNGSKLLLLGTEQSMIVNFLQPILRALKDAAGSC